MKTTKVYSGPGYPVDPKREERRSLECVSEALDFAHELIRRERPQQFVNEFVWSGQNCVEDLIGRFAPCSSDVFGIATITSDSGGNQPIISFDDSSLFDRRNSAHGRHRAWRQWLIFEQDRERFEHRKQKGTH